MFHCILVVNELHPQPLRIRLRNLTCGTSMRQACCACFFLNVITGSHGNATISWTNIIKEKLCDQGLVFPCYTRIHLRMITLALTVPIPKVVVPPHIPCGAETQQGSSYSAPLPMLVLFDQLVMDFVAPLSPRQLQTLPRLALLPNPNPTASKRGSSQIEHHQQRPLAACLAR